MHILETLKVFDEEGNHVGEATREEVHRLGLWHETFHFWLLSQEDGVQYIYFQLRSEAKKDYPNLLDITAAGHLLAHEGIEDGIREVKEEIGLEYSLDELTSLGMIKYSMVEGNLIDNEMAHVYIYQSDQPITNFILQKEEVSGIYKATLDSFYALWLDKQEEIKIWGFEIDKVGNKEQIQKLVTKAHFVPHHQYFFDVALLILQKLG